MLTAAVAAAVMMLTAMAAAVIHSSPSLWIDRLVDGVLVIVIVFVMAIKHQLLLLLPLLHQRDWTRLKKRVAVFKGNT